MAPLPLKVNPLFHSWPPKQVVAASGALLKTQVKQQSSQVREFDTGIRAALQYPTKQLLVTPHLESVPLRPATPSYLL